MKAVKRFFPSVKFVVQLSHSAMNNSTPSEIARRVREYEETANYTLIDPSGGKGREFDIEHSIAVYEALRNQVPQTTIGFAGGFTGANVEQRVLTLKQRLETEDFCIDAEGGLRDKITDEYGDDLLNLDKVKDYLRKATKGLK